MKTLSPMYVIEVYDRVATWLGYWDGETFQEELHQAVYGRNFKAIASLLTTKTAEDFINKTGFGLSIAICDPEGYERLIEKVNAIQALNLTVDDVRIDYVR